MTDDLTNDERRDRRAAVVIDHMQGENVQDWDRVMRTFSRPRYELPTGQQYEGHEDVMRYWIEGRTVVPDQRNELIELTHLPDGAAQIEFWLRGTPTTTNRPFEVRLWAIFDFDESDLMTNERVFTTAPSAEQIAGAATS